MLFLRSPFFLPTLALSALLAITAAAETRSTSASALLSKDNPTISSSESIPSIQPGEAERQVGRITWDPDRRLLTWRTDHGTWNGSKFIRHGRFNYTLDAELGIISRSDGVTLRLEDNKTAQMDRGLSALIDAVLGLSQQVGLAVRSLEPARIRGK